MDTEFRSKIAKHATAKPEFFKSEYQPHPELVRIADALREGRSLKEVAIRAWTYQEQQQDLPVHVAARFRTIFRRIRRHQNLAAV